MASLSDIRDGLAEVIADACPGVTVHRLPSPSVDVPAVVLGGFTFDEIAFGGVQRVNVDVFVVVSGRDTDLLDDLDALVDPSRSDSVVSAIDDDADLGGRAMSARVASVGEYRPEDNAGSPAYAATVRVEVML
jgi:hypothetical protein